MQTHFSEEEKKHILAGVVVFQAVIIMVLVLVNTIPLVQIQGHTDNKPIDTYGWTGALVPGTATSDIQELQYLEAIAENSHGNINGGLWSEGTPNTYYLTAKHGTGLINDFVVKSNEKYLGIHILSATYGDWYSGIGVPNYDVNYDVIVFQTH